MNLAKYLLDNTKAVYFFLAVLLIGGIFSFGRLGKRGCTFRDQDGSDYDPLRGQRTLFK